MLWGKLFTGTTSVRTAGVPGRGSLSELPRWEGASPRQAGSVFAEG